MLTWLILLLACRPPGPSEPPEPERWEAVQLGASTIGARWWAHREAGADRVVWQGQRYLWSLDGIETEVRTLVRAELDPTGAVVHLRRQRDDRVDHWRGEGARWLELDAWEGTLEPGIVSALDPGALAVVQTEVHPTPTGLRWTFGAVQTEVQRDPHVVLWGGVSARPSSEEPTLIPVDPVALFRVPVAGPVPAARKSKRALWRVDGAEVRVESPLDLEIPRARLELIRELVAEVRSRLEHAPTPGSADALAALQRGTGDCNEFAAVFVTLAAARDLTARPVSGLVYTDGGGRGPGLDLHAWVEVDLGPTLGWVPVDPALDQPIADATHLPLAVGEDLAAAVAALSRPMAIELVSVR